VDACAALPIMRRELWHGTKLRVGYLGGSAGRSARPPPRRDTRAERGSSGMLCGPLDYARRC